MFLKKQKKIKKRVVCPIGIIIRIMQETIDIDAGISEFIIQFEGEEHKVGLTSDYDRKRGFFNSLFYLDEQEFDTFEKFKAGAVLNGRLFADRDDDVEITEADKGVTKFPWYVVLEDYIVV